MEVHNALSAISIRSELDENSSTIGYKIRDAETQKIPYMAICGEREEKSNATSVRRHGGEELGSVTVEELGKVIQRENKGTSPALKEALRDRE